MPTARYQLKPSGRLYKTESIFEAYGFRSGVRDSIEQFESSVLEFVKWYKVRVAMVYACRASPEQLFNARQRRHYWARLID